MKDPLTSATQTKTLTSLEPSEDCATGRAPEAIAVHRFAAGEATTFKEDEGRRCVSVSSTGVAPLSARLVRPKSGSQFVNKNINVP